jgi:hypothetical protein
MYALSLSLLAASLLAIQDKPKVSADKDDKKDYEAALNDILAKGITPEKNANVLLWKALGPSPEGGPPMPAEFYRRLGIPEPPKDGEYFVGLQRYMMDHLKLQSADYQPIYDQQGWAMKRPWKADDYPRIAAWLALNDKPLAVVIEATKRPQYYNPLVSRKNEKGQGSLIGVLMPSVQKCRELASALTARAMFRVGAGRYDDAWQDLLAAHRLGRLSARGGTLIEALVGIAIDSIASQADLAYLQHAKLTSKEILDRLKDLQALPPMPPMADKIDVGERHMYHDSLELVRSGGVGMLEGFADGKVKKPTEEELKALAMIDWAPARKIGDKFYDRLAAAMRLKDRQARVKEFDKIEGDIKAVKADAVSQMRLLADLVAGKDPGKEIGQAIGSILVSLLLPAAAKVQDAHDRVTQIERNLHIAFALAAYHRDNGRYPAKLDDLAPKYLASVPNDIFSGKGLIYRPGEKGYLFYSVGVNGQDEGGRWVDDDPRGDDPGVRMPLAALKK